MTRYGHIAWRVVAVVAFAGTAALAVTLTRAPARSDNANLSANLSQNPCVTSGLDATGEALTSVTGVSNPLSSLLGG